MSVFARRFAAAQRIVLFWVLSLAACNGSSSACGAESIDPRARFFEERVRPVLAEHCYGCHGADKQSGDLRVDSLAGLLAGGGSGEAIVRGKPDESLLIEAIRYESYEMPPDGQLADEQIAAIERWVEMGAPWPGHDAAIRDPASQAKITAEDRAWWAFQPLGDPAPPMVECGGWCRNDVDRFLYRRLAERGLQPSPPADRRTLIRRVTLDLTGLPPHPEQVESFVADSRPGAYERLVDRLLDSPAYGERWARHWLDLVRYAESDGYRQDAFRPHAWRYRDYVIRAFNQDKPYDQFVREQLAGDELAPHDKDALAATSFLRHWIYEYNQRDVRTQWENILIDVTNVTGEVFLGLGFGCARCHDHKFDPILREDYYRLKAFFTPLQPRDDLPFASASEFRAHHRQRAVWEDATREIREQIEELERPLIEAARRAAADKFPPDIREMLTKSPERRTPLEQQLSELAYRQAKGEIAKVDPAKRLKGEQLERWQQLQERLAEHDDLKPAALPPAFTVSDVGPEAPETMIPGDRRQRDIAPGFLAVLDADPPQIEPPPGGGSTGRRTALARWLTDPENPLTARVIVNRVWQQHFGTGLVATASDFGRLGEPPSHPELLDWLARRFIQDGWRFKSLDRLIVTSAAYRQAAISSAAAAAWERDPQNRLLWRMPPHRLDAEQIRDRMLAVSGELDLAAGGPSVDGSRPRRSIYVKVLRNRRDPLLGVFDAADPFASVARRDTTTTPNQALFLFNGDWPRQRARALARRLERAAAEGQLVDRAYRLAYGRSASEEEVRCARQFLEDQAERYRQAGEAEAPEVLGEMPGREGSGALEVAADGPRLAAPATGDWPDGDFTLEAVILLRSLYPDATVRTIVSQWDDNQQHPGWSLGVTSTKSRYQPRNLILQMVGDPQRGGGGYEVIASGLRPELNRPTYVAVSVRVQDRSPAGVTFYLKDLARPDAQLQTARVPHRVTGDYRAERPVVIGGRHGSSRHRWDGWIDDVRISNAALARDQLLLFEQSAAESTVGFWRFDDPADPLADTSARERPLAAASAATAADPRMQALTDFCHAILNSSEFLYVD